MSSKPLLDDTNFENNDSGASLLAKAIQGERAPRPINKTLVLDLGDVIFHWTTDKLTKLPKSVLRSVFLSPAWLSLERGTISYNEALKAVAAEISIDSTLLHEALGEVRPTLRADHGFINEFQQLKEEMEGRMKLVAMTNVSEDDFALLRGTLPDWTLFDETYTSFSLGVRKPELAFYRQVLNAADADPRTTIFIDDKIDNVIAARTFGITSLVFDSAADTLRQLRNILFDPISRGREFLEFNRLNLWSEVEDGPQIRDAFSQLLILESIRDRGLIELRLKPTKTDTTEQATSNMAEHEIARTWNYFIDEPVGTTSSFPDDVDTTSCALLALSPTFESANRVLDLMLKNRNSGRLVQTYFDELRPRVDPVVLVNVLRAFYKYGRGNEVGESYAFVSQTLKNRGYVDGTLHYYSAESFLFFLSRLVSENPTVVELQKLRPVLAERLKERVGRQDDSLAVAMRALACQTIGVWAGSDVKYLISLQDSDGGWEIGWVCRFGRSRKRIGNRGVVTAYAVQVLEAAKEIDPW